MKKKSFTLVEVLLTISIISLLFVISRSFLNVNRQEKFLFGERCMKYMFTELDKFQTDFTYGKNSVNTISGVDMVQSSISFLWYTWTTNNAKAVMLLYLQDKDANDYEYKKYQFSHTSTLWTSRPTQCMSPKYIMSYNTTTFSQYGNIVMFNSKQNWWYFTDDGTAYPNQFTWDVIISVCDAINISNGVYSQWSRCSELWKIIADKRSWKISYLVCNAFDSISWKCTARPKY